MSVDNIPIDIHYLKLEEWLQDRSAVLKKKHQHVYDAVKQLAPMLVQRMKYDLSATKKSLSRAEGAAKGSLSAIEDSKKAANQLRASRRAFLARYGLLSGAGGTGATEEGGAGITGTVEEEEDRVLADVEGTLNRRIDSVVIAQESEVRHLVLYGNGEGTGNGTVHVPPHTEGDAVHSKGKEILTVKDALDEFSETYRKQFSAFGTGSPLGVTGSCNSPKSSPGGENENGTAFTGGESGGGSSAAVAKQCFPWLSSLLLETARIGTEGEGESAKRGTEAPPLEQGPAAAEIDWGDFGGGEEEGTNVAVGTLLGGPVICLEIDYGETGEGITAADITIVDEDKAKEEVTATGTAVCTTGTTVAADVSSATQGLFLPPADGVFSVCDEKPRVLLTEELKALRAFFYEQQQGCCLEQQQQQPGGAVNLGAGGTQQVPPISCGGSIRRVSGLVSLLDRILQEFADSAVSELLRMRNSFHHKERFLQKVTQFGHNAMQKEQRCSQLEEQRLSALKEVVELEPELQRIVAEVKQLQDRCETLLSQVYTPRVVSLVGDLNAL